MPLLSSDFLIRRVVYVHVFIITVAVMVASCSWPLADLKRKGPKKATDGCCAGN